MMMQSDDGRECRFEVAEDWLLRQGIEEGDEWPEDIEAIEGEQERINRMADWMENYYEAMQELES